ncbi:sensor histidine kinase [Clostridium neuense]|uniref:histidine kinase n=1 Tax=Clostridium neuense TaxID=1728934 RepID=A0ABW8TCA6_9CLOT
MNKLLTIWNFIKTKTRYLLLIYTGIILYTNYKSTSPYWLFLILLDIFLIIYTFIELNKNHSKECNIYFYLISISIYSVIWLLGNCDNIYYFVLLDDLFEIKDYRRRNYFLTFHAAMFVLVIFSRQLLRKSFFSSISSLLYIFLIYGLIFITFLLIHKLRWDRDKLKLLNSDLIEYSFKEREYLISSERTRISQELHDSIGHSLMALSMNVRYIKAIKDKKEIDEELDNIDILVKESIDTLRTTVYNLRKLDEASNFQEQVRNIIKKFNELNMVRINFDCDSEIENESQYMKNILLTTIKEGITNGLKHGDPSEINISVELIISDNNSTLIKLLITNNGQGCKNIIKSHGLNGITERIESVHGTVNFKSPKSKGFIIEALIPKEASLK